MPLRGATISRPSRHCRPPRRRIGTGLRLRGMLPYEEGNRVSYLPTQGDAERVLPLLNQLTSAGEAKADLLLYLGAMGHVASGALELVREQIESKDGPRCIIVCDIRSRVEWSILYPDALPQEIASCIPGVCRVSTLDGREPADGNGIPHSSIISLPPHIARTASTRARGKSVSSAAMPVIRSTSFPWSRTRHRHSESGWMSGRGTHHVRLLGQR